MSEKIYTKFIMSLYDKISVGLGSGAGTKASKLYSLLPVNGDGDFTVTRNTAAYKTNEDGLLESVEANVPRWDYSKSDCPALLLESQSTNLITYSEDFNNGSWNKRGNPIKTTTELAPDNSSTGSSVELGNSGVQDFYQSVLSGIGNSVEVFPSFYIKKISNTGTIRIIDPQSSGRWNIDLSKLSDSWERIDKYHKSVTIISAFTSTGAGASGILFASLDTTVYSVTIWGCQLETISTTSYIKTEALAVTRDKDEVNGSGTAAEFNGSSGVLYANIAALEDDLTHRLICISDGTNQQRIFFGYYNTSNTINCRVINSGVEQANFYHPIDDIKKFHKIAVTYKLNEFTLWVDGVKVANDTSGILPTGLNDLSFNQIGSHLFYGHCKEVIVFKESLTDDELIKLTT